MTSQPPVETCEYTSLLAGQPDIWPMPLIAIMVWSLAPTLATIGIWSAPLPRMGLVYAALAIEATVVMIGTSLAAFFAPLVLLPLALTTYLASRNTVTTRDLPPTGREV